MTIAESLGQGKKGPHGCQIETVPHRGPVRTGREEKQRRDALLSCARRRVGFAFSPLRLVAAGKDLRSALARAGGAAGLPALQATPGAGRGLEALNETGLAAVAAVLAIRGIVLHGGSPFGIPQGPPWKRAGSGARNGKPASRRRQELRADDRGGSRSRVEGRILEAGSMCCLNNNPFSAAVTSSAARSVRLRARRRGLPPATWGIRPRKTDAARCIARAARELSRHG